MAHHNTLVGIELENGPLCFSFKQIDEDNVVKRRKYEYSKELNRFSSCSIWLFSAFSDMKKAVDNFLKFFLVRKDLQRLNCVLEQRCSCVNSFWCNEEDGRRIEKGFALLFHSEHEQDAGEVENVLTKYDVRDFYRTTYNDAEAAWIAQLTNVGDDSMSDKMVLVPTKTKLSSHPTFLYEEYNPVYHDYERAKRVLEECCDQIPAAQKTLDIAAQHIDETMTVNELQSQMTHPLVIIEGLDATGKTTLTQTLGERMKATKLCTPPPCIAHLRGDFDQYPEFIRRAYYSIGNYIVAFDIAKACQEGPVVMDRFWHSTAAYAIAHESGDLDLLPTEDHPVYKWPDDLIKPSGVILLTVTEEIRNMRLNQRNLEKTWEEKHSSKNRLFRQRLADAYRRMTNPSCIEIDASPSEEEVQNIAIKRLDQLDIIKLPS